MQKIPFGIRMPNKPFCPFAQMDKVQHAHRLRPGWIACA
jgi:hypothetical protein